MKKIFIYLVLPVILMLCAVALKVKAQNIQLPDDWTATVSGSEVTLSYSGSKTVKSVTLAPRLFAFSVSGSKQVYFSKGNLQYNKTAGEFQFAATQWEYMGTNQNPIIDYFGWGTWLEGGNPINTSKTGSQYTWDDSKLSVIGNAWTTLTSDEWKYLVSYDAMSNTTRATKFGEGKVNGVNGVILLPDDFEFPENLSNSSFVSGNSAWENIYLALDWEKMEKNGAIFLPAAGRREGNDIGFVGSDGHYWSCTEGGVNKAYNLNFHGANEDGIFGRVQIGNPGNTYCGYSVRLVSTSAPDMPTPTKQTNNKWTVALPDYNTVELIVVYEVPYAILSADGTTLTFKYGEKPTLDPSEGKVYNYDLVLADMGAGDDDYTEWYVELGYEGTSKITKVVFESSFANFKPKTCKHLFFEFEQLTEIQGLQYLNTEDVTDMSDMFSNCYKLSSLNLDLEHFSTANVTTMKAMFYLCKELTQIKGLEKFDTKNVTDMSYMFCDCEALTEITFGGNFKTDKVTNMRNMFDRVNSVTSLNVSSFNTENVTNMSEMFSGYKLPFLDLSTFNTANVENMSNMFSYSPGLVTIDLSGFNTAKVANMDGMFNGCTSLSTIKVSGNWTFKNGVSSSYMFGWDDNELIGDCGTKFDMSHNDNTYARIDKKDEPGYFSTDDYKIFYQWADDETKTYQAHTSSTFSGAADVVISEPEREGYNFEYWTRVSASGEQIGESSAKLTIAAGDFGNRIYQMHWSIVNHTVSFYNGTTFISSVEVPHGEKLSDNQYPSPQKTGHILIKWTVTDDPDENGYGNYAVNEDIDLYAQWMKDKFFVWIPEHFEYITTNDDDDLFEFDSEVKFKISEGYTASEVYYTLGESTDHISLIPNADGVYTYKVSADVAQFYSNAKEFYTIELGKNASANLPFASNASINFTSDNSNIFVSNNQIVTTNNVAKGDVGVLTSDNYQIKVTIIDPFENYYDSEKWNNEDVVFACPENDNNWTLEVEGFANNTISEEGETAVVCKILDSENNTIAKESFVVKIDKAVPTITSKVTSGGNEYEIVLKNASNESYYFSTGSKIAFASSDELSGRKSIEYSYDNNTFNVYNGEILLPQGINTIYVRATDIADNTSEPVNAELIVFDESNFVDNSLQEIALPTIYYTSKQISDLSVAINLNGNTIGAITDSKGNVQNFDVSGNNINISADYIKTLSPGENNLYVHINPNGDTRAWDAALNPANYENQILKITLDIQYKLDCKLNFEMIYDNTVSTFCQGDMVKISFDVDNHYSSVIDSVVIENLEVYSAFSDDGIVFKVPDGSLKGGDEIFKIKYFNDDYMYEDETVFPSNFPSEYNVKVFDDVLAIDNSLDLFAADGYTWYVDLEEIKDYHKQYLYLTPYMKDNNTHVFSTMVTDIRTGKKFRICPDDNFVIQPIAKKKTIGVNTYPNPAVSNLPVYIELKNFPNDDFSDLKILIYNQLGSLVYTNSNVETDNKAVFGEGFYNGVVLKDGIKIISFKFVVNK